MNMLPRFVRQHPLTTVFAVLFVLLAGFVVSNLTAPMEDKQLAAIRQAGYPVTLAELNLYYPAVPDEENAALLYQRVFDSAFFTNRVLDDLINELGKVERGYVVPEADRAELDSLLATNAAVWQLVYRATNCSGSRYPMDMQAGHMLLLTHLAKIKRTTQLLSLEALARASAGQSNEAFAAVNAALNVGDSLRQEPLLISFLVRIASSALATKRLEQSLNLVPFQAAQLRSLQQRFAAEDDPRWPTRALAGERAFGLAFFIDRKIQHSIMQPQQGIGLGPTGVAGQALLTLYRASGIMSMDRNYYVGAMATNLTLAALPAELRVKAGPPPSMVTSNRFLFVSRLILPALGRVLDRADDYSARMRVAETAMAVERYRLDHADALPDTLDKLAPQYLAAIPVDPFDSQPIRYKKLPRGFAVYSIGADRKDDGGVDPEAVTKSGKKLKTTSPDITFIVERK